jgi:hypothetical protein
MKHCIIRVELQNYKEVEGKTMVHWFDGTDKIITTPTFEFMVLTLEEAMSQATVIAFLNEVKNINIRVE